MRHGLQHLCFRFAWINQSSPILGISGSNSFGNLAWRLPNIGNSFKFQNWGLRRIFQKILKQEENEMTDGPRA